MNRIVLILSVALLLCVQAFSAKVVTIRKDMPLTEQMATENTVYKFTTDVDLRGTTVIVPSGCTLQLKNGVLSNGVLVGQDTKIITAKKKRFGNQLHVQGTWKVDNVYSEWFGAKGDGTDETDALIAFFNFPALKKTLKPGLYGVKELHCDGLDNTEIYAYGATLQYLRTNLDSNTGLDCAVLTNYSGKVMYDKPMKGWIHIYGLTIDGNSQNFVYNPKPEKHTDIINHHTLRFILLDELILKDCTFKNSFMTAVMLDVCKKSEITDCTIVNSGESVNYVPDGFWYTWEGVSVNDRVYTFDKGWRTELCDECVVKNSYFENIGGSFASANCRVFRCYNNKVKDNRGYAFELSKVYEDRVVDLHNNEFHGVGTSALNMTYFDLPDKGKNTILIYNNSFYELGYDSHRTVKPIRPFLMVYRNKNEGSQCVLDVQIKSNLFELTPLATQGLIKSDSFVFEGNTCRGYTGEKNSALFFCGNDENVGSYVIKDNEIDMNSGALSIIRSPRRLEVTGNKVSTSLSPAIVYVQGDVSASDFVVKDNEVDGVESLIFLSSPAAGLNVTGNKSKTIKQAIFRTSSDLKIKGCFRGNSFEKISWNMMNIEVVR